MNPDGPRDRVTVVIPAYEASRWIGDALDSIAAQTRPPDECIVVDDGSSDDTAEVVRARAARSGLPVHLIHQDNRGAAHARSTGVMASTGDGVVLLDADDVLHPLALATLHEGATACPEAVACFGDAERVTFEGVAGPDYLSDKSILSLPYEERRASRPGTAPSFRLVSEGVFESLLDGSYIANCASWVDREAAIRAGLWNEAFRTAEDRDFWLRLCRLGPFAYTPARLATVRYHEASLTSERGQADHLLNGAHVLGRLLDNADSLGLSASERIATEAALERGLENALYTASQEGIGTYLRIAGAVRRTGRGPRHLSPKHLLRALVRVSRRHGRPRLRD